MNSLDRIGRMLARHRRREAWAGTVRWGAWVLAGHAAVLAALLANGVKDEILVGVYFVQRNDLAALRPFVPELPGVFPGGGSLWMRSR